LSFYFPIYTILKYDKNTRIFFSTSIVDNTRIRVLLSLSSNDPICLYLHRMKIQTKISSES